MFHLRTCHNIYPVLYTLTTVCSTLENAIRCILSCTHSLPLYFMCERARRRILSFTHSLRLYSIQRTLLYIKPIWWYRQRLVCARILYCEIFCAILHISAQYPCQSFPALPRLLEVDDELRLFFRLTL